MSSSLYEPDSGSIDLDKAVPGKFAVDSPQEEAVMSELVSEAKFPASWESTGNFAPAGTPEGESDRESTGYHNSL